MTANNEMKDMIDFYLPTSLGEWSAFASAVVTMGFAVLLFVMPRLSLRILRLQTFPNAPSAVSHLRATTAGFYFGVGFCCILLAQPLLYLALGVCWFFAAFGRIVSIMLDKGNTKYNWTFWLIEATLGSLPTLYAFGYF